jgi:hypothetical protein
MIGLRQVSDQSQTFSGFFWSQTVPSPFNLNMYGSFSVFADLSADFIRGLVRVRIQEFLNNPTRPVQRTSSFIFALLTSFEFIHFTYSYPVIY